MQLADERPEKLAVALKPLTSAHGTFQNCGRRQRMSGHRTEADIVRAAFPLSARPASRPLRTAGLS
jgi:hypothetical protein